MKNYSLEVFFQKKNIQSASLFSRLLSAVFLFGYFFSFSQNISVSGEVIVFSLASEKESAHDSKNSNTENALIVKGGAVVFDQVKADEKTKKNFKVASAKVVIKKKKTLHLRPKTRIVKNNQKIKHVHYKVITSFQNKDSGSEILIRNYHSTSNAVSISQSNKSPKAKIEVGYLTKNNLELLYLPNFTHNHSFKKNINFSKILSVRPPPFFSLS